jgi:RNA polymerase sigma-70 factor (ECF subfamily)
MPQSRELILVDEQRFEMAWRTHGTSLLRYCRFAIGSPDAGEDVAAETFARFLQRGDAVAGDKIEAWLFTVAHNLIRTQQRKSSRWLSVLPRLQHSNAASSDAEYETGLVELLAPLSAEQRLAVYLRVIEDRPFAEVARLTGRSEAATKKIVYRALAQLRSIEVRDRQIETHRGGVESE